MFFLHTDFSVRYFKLSCDLCKCVFFCLLGHYENIKRCAFFRRIIKSSLMSRLELTEFSFKLKYPNRERRLVFHSQIQSGLQ